MRLRKEGSIPKFRTEAEEANFWGTHDMRNMEDRQACTAIQDAGTASQGDRTEAGGTKGRDLDPAGQQSDRSCKENRGAEVDWLSNRCCNTTRAIQGGLLRVVFLQIRCYPRKCFR